MIHRFGVKFHSTDLTVPSAAHAPTGPVCPLVASPPSDCQMPGGLPHAQWAGGRASLGGRSGAPASQGCRWGPTVGVVSRAQAPVGPWGFETLLPW